MSPWTIFGDLSPHARAATAILPSAAATFMRLVLGNNQLTRCLLWLGVMWFGANILMAPYSAGMRQDIRNLRTLLA